MSLHVEHRRLSRRLRMLEIGRRARAKAGLRDAPMEAELAVPVTECLARHDGLQRGRPHRRGLIRRRSEIADADHADTPNAPRAIAQPLDHVVHVFSLLRPMVWEDAL